MQSTEILEKIVSLLEASREQVLLTQDRVRELHAQVSQLPPDQQDEALHAGRTVITDDINRPWLQALGMMRELDAGDIERDGRVSPIMQAAWSVQADALIWSPVSTGTPDPTVAKRRASTRKIVPPWDSESLYPAPNVHNHGTRNLARAVSGTALWRNDPESRSLSALVGGEPVAMIDLSPGQEEGALRRILEQVVSPRTIKTMVAVSRLVYERTDRKPVNQGCDVTLGELARAAGYTAGDDRKVSTEIRLRIAQELRALCAVKTWATDREYNKKTRRRAGSWVAPLLIISGVHLEELEDTEGPVPTEIGVMLGRNWANAYASTDLVQIPAGFMRLRDDNVIRLGWYYATEFRYRMTSKRVALERSIRSLCHEAGIDPGGSAHRGRFLDRLERWHTELREKRVIGSHQRGPSIGTDLSPGEIFERGTYAVRPPDDVLDAYAPARGLRSRPPKLRGHPGETAGSPG